MDEWTLNFRLKTCATELITMYSLPTGLELLPSELKRNLTLMGVLDSRVDDLMTSIQEHVDQFTKQLDNSKENIPDDVRKEKIRAVHELFNKAKQYGEDKLQLANQTYELVDKQIRQLDLDLARFKKEFFNDTCEKSKESPTEEGDYKKDGKSLVKKKCAYSSEDDKKVIGASSVEASGSAVQQKINPELDNAAQDGRYEIPHPSKGLDMPVDPNEPVFCLCQQVSHGEMIACDNPDCLIEWFHFECLGLSTKPKGKWFCPDCSQKKK